MISWATKLLPRQTLIRCSYVVLPLLRLLYKGKNVECPVCGGSYRKFLPYGYGEANEKMNNRLCPGCLSLERHRLLWLYLKDKTDFFTSPLRVLHFAPEQPFLKRIRKHNNLDYVTADLDSPIADLHLDITAIEQPDDSYDVLICNHVLEHVDNLGAALSEIKRVLRPRGWAILMVPLRMDMDTYEDPSVTDPKERERLFGQYDHVRQFGRDYPLILSAAGFRVVEDRLYYEISEEQRQRMHLSRPGEEIIYRCEKL